MRKFLKRPYMIIAAVIVLAIVTPVLASGIMHKQQSVSLGAADQSSRVTAQPIANPINNTTVQTVQPAVQSRVTMTPLDKTLDQVQARTKQQASASSQPANASTASAQPASTQTASTPPTARPTTAATQANSLQQQGKPLSDSSFSKLKQQGLSEGQIKKINEIISSGITEDQLAQLLNEQGYGNIAAVLSHKHNDIRSTKKSENKWDNDKQGKDKHQKHGDHHGDKGGD
jgi:hypothetical protein